MTIRIGINIASIGAQRRLNESTNALDRSFERLASGMRINRASDDAAGLAIATSLKTDTRIFSQGIRNVGDAVSALNIAEGAITSLSGMTIRMKELASQSANGTYSRTQRESLNSEAQALIKEFNRIAASTTFNGRQLLDGSLKELFVQAGGNQLQVGIGVGFSRTVGTGTFDSYETLSFSHSTSNTNFGDVNGDGILDAVFALSAASDNVRIALGNGDGTFQAETTVTSFFNARANLFDIDGDGDLDIVGVGNGSGEFHVNLGNGDGTFGGMITHQVYSSFFTVGGNNLQNVAFGDFNGDGIADIVAVNNNTTDPANDRAYVMFGNGNGTFAQGISINVGDITGASTIKVGDIDGDGHLDFVVNSGGANNNILFGNGNGTFRSVQTVAMGGSGGNGSFLVDLNNDGKLDLISAVTHAGGNISVQLGNGDGTFGATSRYRTSTDNAPFVIGDMNGDGIVDFATHHPSYFTISLGRGDGTFDGPITQMSAGNGITLADVNGDGAIEAIRVVSNALQIWSPDTTTTGSIQNFNILTQSNARSVLDFLDTVQSRLGREMASLGAFQSRLQTATNNLKILRENYSSAESRIMDIDVAEETSSLLRTQILQRAGASVLGQTNLQPQLALLLLKN